MNRADDTPRTTATNPPQRLVFFDHLTRITSSGRLIPQVDGLRFIAIMGVVFYHVMTHLSFQAPGAGPEGSAFIREDRFYRMVAVGTFGVSLFYVISGFILALPFAESALGRQPPPSLGRYYLRRLSRLEPTYLIYLAILFFFYTTLIHKPVRELVPHFLATAFYCHSQVYGALNPFTPVTWTLEVEAQFYILAPFLAMVFRLRSAALRRTVLGAAVLGMASFNQWLAPQAPRYALSLLASLQYFLAGFVLVELYLTCWRDESRHRLVWDVASLSAWVGIVVILMVGPQFMWVMPLVMIPAYAGGFRGRLVRAFLGWQWVWSIGGMCYTIYLYHYQMISGPMRLTIRLFNPDRSLWANYLVQCLLLLLPLLAVCSLAYLIFERPFMDRSWPRRLVERMRNLLRPAPAEPDD